MRRLLRTTVLGVTVGIGLVGVTTPARAEDAQAAAARLFRAGSDAYARHDFTEAARDFESAYRTIPRGAAVYNAGLAWEGAGDIAHAADDYATAIGSGDATPEQRSDAASRLKALEARLARLIVTGPADARVTLDDGSDASLPLTTHLQPGHHTVVVAYASGAQQTRTLEASAGEEDVLRLSTPSAAQPVETKTLRHASTSAEPSSTSDGATTRRTLAWVALGGVVVASGVAIALYETGLSALGRFDNSQDTDAGARNQALGDRTGSEIAWGLAGALAVTGVVLFATSSSSPDAPPASSLRVGPTGALLHLAF